MADCVRLCIEEEPEWVVTFDDQELAILADALQVYQESEPQLDPVEEELLAGIVEAINYTMAGE